ncbi:MAG TPA: hypothetical protein DCZ01_04510 [Elusimicrobia bacterium]|nr:MAG: hypothetical protein A2X37_10740 [Elusimicrobia bacterium GWA2_66_18]OGR77246.1 MAG: hypothetical protein A2X40_01165 [Elusimicrobia bacterium GWC2_65_9]HAZ07787.1 hypothetical protein [Elusimicrobiota bacterium]
MSHERPADASDLTNLRDKALGLRETVNGARARFYTQRDKLRRLREELDALRRMTASPAPEAVAVSTPVVEGGALDSARAAATSFPAGAARGRIRLARWAPYAALAVFAVASQLPARRPAAPPANEIPAPVLCADPALQISADDDRGNEAIALLHEWRVPGDDLPIIERLRQPSELPGARPAWTAERTGEKTYRVSFRPTQADPSLEFEVDLDARRVDPSPDTAERLAPRLTARR